MSVVSRHSRAREKTNCNANARRSFAATTAAERKAVELIQVINKRGGERYGPGHKTVKLAFTSSIPRDLMRY